MWPSMCRYSLRGKTNAYMYVSDRSWTSLLSPLALPFIFIPATLLHTCPSLLRTDGRAKWGDGGSGKKTATGNELSSGCTDRCTFILQPDRKRRCCLSWRNGSILGRGGKKPSRNTLWQVSGIFFWGLYFYFLHFVLYASYTGKRNMLLCFKIIYYIIMLQLKKNNLFWE